MPRSIGVLLGCALATASLPCFADELSALAAVGRPLECRQPATSRPLWRGALANGQRRYCAELAAASAWADADPRRALAAALAARRRAPDAVAPRLYEAQARLALGQEARAWRIFSHPPSLELAVASAPSMLVARARAALASADAASAADAYRRLGPSLRLLEDRDARAALLVEASVAAMLLGPDGLVNAERAAKAAHELAVHPGLRWLSGGVWALVRLRQGRAPEAQALLAQLDEPWSALESMEAVLGETPTERWRVGRGFDPKFRQSEPSEGAEQRAPAVASERSPSAQAFEGGSAVPEARSIEPVSELPSDLQTRAQEPAQELVGVCSSAVGATNASRCAPRGPRRLLVGGDSRIPALLPRAELVAIVAALATAREAALSSELWWRYLEEGPSHPAWRDFAAARARAPREPF